MELHIYIKVYIILNFYSFSFPDMHITVDTKNSTKDFLMCVQNAAAASEVLSSPDIL